jgi:hypothetical protein
MFVGITSGKFEGKPDLEKRMGSRIVRVRLPILASVDISRVPASLCANLRIETRRDIAAELWSDICRLQEQRNFAPPFSGCGLLLTIGLD